MTEPDPLARWRRVEAWIRHAEDDARIARGCIGLDPPALGGAAYHCQQAAEKLLKGFLVQAGIDFPRTHELSVLGDLVLPKFASLGTILATMDSWTAWGVAFRYPGENMPEPEPSAEELSQALDLIAQLDGTLRALAPPPVGDTATRRK